jgi:hypothetical protein
MLRKLLLSAGAVIGLMTLAQSASAQQVIFACVNQSSGELKIVAANATCSNNSKLFSWNVTGPSGPAGPAGANGSALAAAQSICLNQRYPSPTESIIFTTTTCIPSKFGNTIFLPTKVTSSNSIILSHAGSNLIEVAIHLLPPQSHTNNYTPVLFYIINIK